MGWGVTQAPKSQESLFSLEEEEMEDREEEGVKGRGRDPTPLLENIMADMLLNAACHVRSST
jgi:hypothetical protein